jgi:hypothetical protein
MMSRSHGSQLSARPNHGMAGAVPTVLATLVLVLTATACDELLVAGPLPEVGNVAAEIGAAVVESDTGIVVNGRPVLSHPNNGQALWVDRFERYDFAGFPELDYPQSARYGLSWRIMLTHEEREQRGDSTIFRFRDHGDVAVASVPMEQLTDPPHLPPGAPPVRFENFVRYLLLSYHRIDWNHGQTTEDQTPFQGDLAAGRELALESTGSHEVLPGRATFAIRPFTLLTGLENNEALQLARSTVPVIDVGEPLVLTFDRPFDAARSYVLLHPMHPHLQPGTRAAFIQTRSPSERVVIPPHLLRQLVDGAAPKTAFRAIIVDILVAPDALPGAFTDALGSSSFSLPLVQRAETSVHLYLRR